MKLKHALSAFGIVVLASTALVTGPSVPGFEATAAAATTAAAAPVQARIDVSAGVPGGSVQMRIGYPTAVQGAITVEAPAGAVFEWLAWYRVDGSEITGGRVSFDAGRTVATLRGQSADGDNLHLGPGSYLLAGMRISADARGDLVGGVVTSRQLPAYGSLITGTGTFTIPVWALVLEQPAPGGVVREAQPTFAGRGLPGATVEVEHADGRTLASTEVGSDGLWSARLEVALDLGAQSGSLRQISADDVVTETPWSFEYALLLGVAVTSPTFGGRVNVARPTIAGVGQPGADIEVRLAAPNARAYRAVVGADGAWQVVPTISLKKGAVDGQVVQSFEGSTAQVAFSFDYGDGDPSRPAVTLSSPTPDGIVYTGAADRVAPVFVGTGSEGARIEVLSPWGIVLGTAVVHDGRWESSWWHALVPGQYQGGQVFQYLPGESAVQSSVGYRFVVQAGDPLAVG